MPVIIFAALHVGDGVHPGPAGRAPWLATPGPALDALASDPSPGAAPLESIADR